MKEGEFWLDNFVGESQGGVFFRAFDLIEFIKKCEEKSGKVVGIKFDGTNNIEIILEKK